MARLVRAIAIIGGGLLVWRFLRKESPEYVSQATLSGILTREGRRGFILEEDEVI